MAENWPWKLPPFMRIYLHSLPVIMFFKKKFFLYFCSKNSAPTRPPRAPRPSQSSSLHWNCAENSNVNWSLSPPIQGPQIDSYIDWFLSTTIKMLWLLFIFQLYEGGKNDHFHYFFVKWKIMLRLRALCPHHIVNSEVVTYTKS